jgi:hypothetical protein
MIMPTAPRRMPVVSMAVALIEPEATEDRPALSQNDGDGLR